MKHVKCPAFVTAVNGIVQSVQCKVCGVVIADTVERTLRYEQGRSGERTRVVNQQFTRLANYREIKIVFEDPTYFHVTNGCNKCLSMSMDIAILAEMHEADQLESPDGYTERERAQKPIGVVTLSATSGIP